MQRSPVMFHVFTCFHQQHFPLRDFREPRCHYSASRSTTHNNKVVLYIRSSARLKLSGDIIIIYLHNRGVIKLTCGRRQGSSRSHCERMNTSSNPMNNIKGPPPQTLAKVGPIGGPAWQLQLDMAAYWSRVEILKREEEEVGEVRKVTGVVIYRWICWGRASSLQKGKANNHHQVHFRLRYENSCIFSEKYTRKCQLEELLFDTLAKARQKFPIPQMATR